MARWYETQKYNEDKKPNGKVMENILRHGTFNEDEYQNNKTLWNRVPDEPT